MTDGNADAIVVLENDLYTRTDAAKVDAALNAAKVLIVADHQKTATSDRADLVLPAASFAEGDGTPWSARKVAPSASSRCSIRSTWTPASWFTKAGAGCMPCAPPC